MQKNLFDGKVLYTESTHLKANANKNKFVKAHITENTRSYLEELDKDVEQDRLEHGKKPLPAKDKLPQAKEIKQSVTDPDSGFMMRDGKPRGFYYLDHRTREKTRENRLSQYGKEIYARRKETVERSFADSKQLRGHRYAKMRSLRKVQEQCLLCAWTSNIKKIALDLSRNCNKPNGTAPAGGIKDIFKSIKCGIYRILVSFTPNFIYTA